MLNFSILFSWILFNKLDDFDLHFNLKPMLKEITPTIILKTLKFNSNQMLFIIY